MDSVEIRQSGDDPDILGHMVDEAFYVHCHFARQQELLLVELNGHFFLEGLVKELSENDNKREYEQKRQDDYRGG